MDDIETVWLELEVKQMRFHRRVAVTDELGFGVSATDLFAKLKTALAKAPHLAKIAEIIHYRLRAGSPPLSVDGGDGYIQIVKPLTESKNPLPNLYVLLGMERVIRGDSDSDGESVEIVDSKTRPVSTPRAKPPPLRFRGGTGGGVDGPHFAQTPSAKRGAKRSAAAISTTPATCDSFALTAPSPVFGVYSPMGSLGSPPSVLSPALVATPISACSIVSERVFKPVTENAMRAADRDRKRYKPTPPSASPSASSPVETSYVSAAAAAAAPAPDVPSPAATVAQAQLPSSAPAQPPAPAPANTLNISISVPAFPVPTLPVVAATLVPSIVEGELDTLLAQLEREDALLEERIRDAEASIRRKKAERVAALQLAISGKRAKLSQLLESNL